MAWQRHAQTRTLSHTHARNIIMRTVIEGSQRSFLFLFYFFSIFMHVTRTNALSMSAFNLCMWVGFFPPTFYTQREGSVGMPRPSNEFFVFIGYLDLTWMCIVEVPWRPLSSSHNWKFFDTGPPLLVSLIGATVPNKVTVGCKFRWREDHLIEAPPHVAGFYLDIISLIMWNICL